MTNGTIRVCADNIRQARKVALINTKWMGYADIGKGKVVEKSPDGRGIFDFEGLK